MKQFSLGCALALILLSSCKKYYEAEELDAASTSNESVLSEIKSIMKEADVRYSIDSDLDGYGETVNMYSELTAIFNPDNIDCGLDDKIKDKIKKSTREGQDVEGFVPDLVANTINEFENAVKLDGEGANILLHLFTYTLPNGETTSAIRSRDTPTQRDFTMVEWIDRDISGFESFYYTVDCSGYFSSSAKASISGGLFGIGKGKIAGAAEGTIGKNMSIVVMYVVVNSPLYAAYKGSSKYLTEAGMADSLKRDIYNKRISTLEGILSAIRPSDRADDMQIKLKENYKTVLASNKGEQGFNGKGSLESNLDLRFKVNLSARIKAENTINRKTKFESYDTYILDSDVRSRPDIITLKNLKDKIIEIEELINALSS